MNINISRPCFDKYHRCPRWAGAGNHYAKREECAGGRVIVDYDNRYWKLLPWRCDTCGVVVLPYAIRFIDPTNAKYTIRQIGRFLNPDNMLWVWKVRRALHIKRRANRVEPPTPNDVADEIAFLMTMCVGLLAGFVGMALLVAWIAS